MKTNNNRIDCDVKTQSNRSLPNVTTAKQMNISIF